MIHAVDKQRFLTIPKFMLLKALDMITCLCQILDERNGTALAKEQSPLFCPYS